MGAPEPARLTYQFRYTLFIALIAEVSMVQRVRVDEKVCLGNAICMGIAPDFFELDEVTDIAVVLGSPTPENVQAAILACPTQAIFVVDDGE
jgi:ferredoxin